MFLWPNLPHKNFTGNISIATVCKRPTNFILLNTKKLVIGEVKVISATRGSLLVNSVRESETLENLYIGLNQPCKSMEIITVNIEFSGPIADNLLEGFYVSEYKKRISNEVCFLDVQLPPLLQYPFIFRRLGATHMEPTAARRAFPCFDEPAFKANFSLRMKRDANHKVVIQHAESMLTHFHEHDLLVILFIM